MSPPLGQRFGRYVVESQVGIGGMGVVYAAVDTHLQRQVALKVVATQYAESPEFRERFQREAATLARLDSPHIIAIFDHGEEGAQPYLATQLVRGGDLGRLLERRGPLPPAQALTVCAQVADALTDAHAAGVVHRDIKPSNVLVRDPDAARLHAYLCDFGIAHEETADRLTTVGGVVGTWAYLAPERTHGAPATPASDLYALGCLLWVCLTGQAPYVGTDLRVAMAHVSEPVRQLRETDPLARHLNQVFARTMAKDPAHRYPDAARLREALESAPAPSGPLVPVPLPSSAPPSWTPAQPAAPAARPPSVEPPTLAGRPSTPGSSPAPWGPPSGPPAGPPPSAGSRRRRWPLVVAGALAVVIAAGAIVWVTTRDDGPGPDPGPGPAASAVRGDLDGDGLGDAVAGFQDGTDGQQVRYTLTSDGSSFATEETELEQSEFPVYVDWDADGTADPLLPELTDAGLDLGSDDPRLAEVTFPGVTILDDYAFVDTLAGDFTGDGTVDLAVWGQSQEQAITVWVLAGTGEGFEDPLPWLELPGAHVYTTSLAVGDFDADGTDDLLASLPARAVTFDGTSTTYDGPRGTRLYSPTGNDTFSGVGSLVIDPALESSYALVPGDFTGSGRSLVALSGDPAAAPIVRFYEVSTTGLTERPELAVEVPDESGFFGSARMTVSDVDGDADDDLVLTKKVSDTEFLGVRVAISEGDSFGAPEEWATTPSCVEDLCFLFFAPTFGGPGGP